MNGIHEAFKEALNVPYDPAEVRWCVWGEVDGETEWLETVSPEFAVCAMKYIGENGGVPRVKKVTRDEIREQFGEPEGSVFAAARTGEALFAALDVDECGLAVVELP